MSGAEHPRDIPRLPEASPMLRLLDRPLSDAALAASAQSTAMPAEVRSTGTVVGLLVFRLGGETLALRARMLRGVTHYAKPIRIPHKSIGVLRGVCNIRGELVLCADLRGMLGIPASASVEPKNGPAPDERRMVVIGAAEGPWAFEVDGLVGIERTELEAMAPPPVTVKYAMGGCTAGVATIKGHGVTVLDGERVLGGFQAGLA